MLLMVPIFVTIFPSLALRLGKMSGTDSRN
jgi:hypothetical protein